ncbi:MAG TPA: hypothetical protein VIN71_02395 [Pseudomonadales bacterium]
MSGAGDNIQVVRCLHCDQPATTTSGQCPHCGKKLTGKEPPYIAFTPATADWRDNIKPLLIVLAVIYVFSGFSLGTWSSLLMILAGVIFVIKSLREL